MHEVAIIRGDGIGPEICDATVCIMAAAGAKLCWEEVIVGQEARRRVGTELPPDALEKMRHLGVVLKGPLIADRCSGGVIVEKDGVRSRYPSVNNGLRNELGTFANVRAMHGWPRISGRYETLDVVIVRELTEDLYIGSERRCDGEAAEAIRRISRFASCRIGRFACQYALRQRRKKITAVHKANVLHETDGLFLESVRSVAREFPELAFEDRMVDAAGYCLVRQPELLDVLVLPNQYGDILSGVAAGLIGSLGLAPGANFGEEVAVFEAAHGTAPDLAGKGVANPVGLILSGAMLLDHLQEPEAAGRIRGAVAQVLSEGRCLTPDLGGRSSTAELTRTICERIP